MITKWKLQNLQTEQKAAQKLLEEGNQRLENSLKKGDFSDIQAAYALSKRGTEKIKSIDEEMTKIMENVSIIQQKRVRAEHEQLKKENKLVDEQSKNENDDIPCDENRGKIDDLIAIFGPINCALYRDKIDQFDEF